MKSFEELKKQFGVEEIEDEEIKSSMEFTRLESVMEQKIMEDVCFKEAYEKYGQYEDWYRSANYCAGYNCPEYDKCKARKEFDDLPKYGVTDYEMEEAANRERIYGVWDRETNNY